VLKIVMPASVFEPVGVSAEPQAVAAKATAMAAGTNRARDMDPPT
jgi:hypothetical protein